MEEFYTRSIASEGVKVPLTLPNGEPSEHWIQMRGIDSDEYKKADAAVKRKLLEVSKIEDADKRFEAGQDLEREVIAAIIAGWSFSLECTTENKMKFLKEAPQIHDQLNQLSANRKYVFRKGSMNSSSGQAESST